MKVLDLLCRCYNCDYRRTMVPNRIPDYVKDMYVKEFKLGKVVGNGRLTALEILIEGRDRL